MEGSETGHKAEFETAYKADLQRCLQVARESMLSTLDGLSEYDARRPLVPTGTNLLGLVKHLATVEAGYFGETFARPFPEPIAWYDSHDPNIDLWATPEESREQLVGLYRRVWSHADATIEALGLDDVGRVRWWRDDRATVTLHRILVHVTAETNRHAGHADIVRELIDGTAGSGASGGNLWVPEGGSWTAHHDRVEEAAQRFR